MVVVGADVHKRTHTFVAVDAVGRKLGEKTVETTSAGHADAMMWAREQFGTDLMWAIEDCRTCRRGWNATCWLPASRWFGYRRS